MIERKDPSAADAAGGSFLQENGEKMNNVVNIHVKRQGGTEKTNRLFLVNLLMNGDARRSGCV